LAKRSSVQRSWVQGAQAEATFGQATQDLIVRVAQAYFDVLASQDSLTFIQAQKVAISEQLARRSGISGRHGNDHDTHESASAIRPSQRPRKSPHKVTRKSRSAPCQQIVGKFPERLDAAQTQCRAQPT